MGKILFIAVVLLGVLTAGVFWANTSETLLFDTVPWVVVASAALGFLLGAIRARLKGREKIVGEEVIRHGGGAFLGHWGTALGAFVLIVSGILLGFLFIPSQADTTAKALFPLNLQFIGVVFLLFGGFHFVADFLFSGNYSRLIPNLQDITGGTLGKYMLRREWRAEGKYLSSQKSAFLGFAVLGTAILVTGAIKVAAHIWPIQASVLLTTTYIHDIFVLLSIMMLIVHVLFVLVFPEHRPALKGWFTGKLSAEHAQKEHPLWYEELKKNE